MSKKTATAHKLQNAEKTQEQLLKLCVSKSLNLSDELKNNGWTYDDLRYSEDTRFAKKKKPVLTLEDFARKKNGIPVLSFFSGAGGLDLGFETAGFSHAALFEHNELFSDTLRLNRQWKVYGPPDYAGDVSNFDDVSGQISKLLPSKSSDGIFIGGPPCQPFSIAANQRFNKDGDNFKRIGFAHKTNGNLLFDYIKLITKFRPRAFLIENVPGLVEVDGGKQLKAAYLQLEKAGYKVHNPVVFNTAEYNVPQQRLRLFIIGNRVGKDYIAPVSGEKLSCSHVFEMPLKKAHNHITREHSAESVLRYMQLEYGERDQLGRVDRLDPRMPSKTVIAGGASGGGRSHLHPYIPRTLSVRESARLQTFPENYIFTGPIARQFTQVGNAVPPVMAAQIAISMIESFY